MTKFDTKTQMKTINYYFTPRNGTRVNLWKKARTEAGIQLSTQIQIKNSFFRLRTSQFGFFQQRGRRIIDSTGISTRGGSVFIKNARVTVRGVCANCSIVTRQPAQRLRAPRCLHATHIKMHFYCAGARREEVSWKIKLLSCIRAIINSAVRAARPFASAAPFFRSVKSRNKNIRRISPPLSLLGHAFITLKASVRLLRKEGVFFG
jgi:hypothetical protein